jgi:small subunit ribosomal protein S1
LPLAVLRPQDEERLVFSHRRASSDADMQNFRVGDVVTGVVTSVKVYGAFLDIGGAMGLLHISQITHERLTTVEQVLQVRPAMWRSVGSAADCGGVHGS